MNTKIKKLRTERHRVREKIAALEDRSRDLEQQITELENQDIVDMVRESGLSPEALSRLIRPGEGEAHE